MFNSAILDVAMGLAFIFLMLSLLVSAVCEMIAGVLKWRSENLWSGLEQLLQSPEARDALYNHPLVRGLSQLKTTGMASPAAASAQARLLGSATGAAAGAAKVSAAIEWAAGHHGPSYIPSRTFALALIDVIRAPHTIAASVRRRLDTLIDDMARNPSQTLATLQGAFDEFANDAALDADQKARLHALSVKLLAGVDAAVLDPLKAQVQELVGRVSESDAAAMNGVRQWLATAGTAANYGQLRSGLATAVALIPSGGQTVSEARAALQGVLQRFTLGSPEAVASELQQFVASSKDIRKALDNAGAGFEGLVGSLGPMLDDAAGDVDRFRDSVEAWFNDGMDRVGGWYKRHVTMVQAGIGLALALALNIDALQITRTLWRDPALRQSMASQAQAYANEPHPTLQRPPTEFPVGSAQGTPLRIQIAPAEVSFGDTRLVTITVAAADHDRTVTVESTSANLSLSADQAARIEDWKDAVMVMVPKDGTETKAYVRLKSNGRNESLESLRVTVNDTTASSPVTVQLVAVPTADQQFDTLRAQIDSLGLPIGWRGCDGETAGDRKGGGGSAATPGSTASLATPLLWCAAGGWNWWGLLPMLLGWAITASAVSLGAPFWFDSLKRIISIRLAGKAPDEQPVNPAQGSAPREPGQRTPPR